MFPVTRLKSQDTAAVAAAIIIPNSATTKLDFSAELWWRCCFCPTAPPHGWRRGHTKNVLFLNCEKRNHIMAQLCVAWNISDFSTIYCATIEDSKNIYQCQCRGWGELISGLTSSSRHLQLQYFAFIELQHNMCKAQGFIRQNIS